MRLINHYKKDSETIYLRGDRFRAEVVSLSGINANNDYVTFVLYGSK